MKASGLRSLVLIAGLTVLTLGHQNCSQATSFSSKSQTMGQSSTAPIANNGGTTTDNPKPTVDLTMGGFDPGDVQNAELCLGELTIYNSASESSNSGSGSSGSSSHSALSVFEIVFGTLFKSSGSSSSLRFSQSLGNQPVTALPSGTYLQPVMIPAGTYDQVEVRLSDNCNKTSMAIQNRNGRIQVRKDVTMRFSGSLTVYPGDPQLRLNLAPIMSALSNARDSKDVEDALDRTDGGL